MHRYTYPRPFCLYLCPYPCPSVAWLRRLLRRYRPRRSSHHRSLRRFHTARLRPHDRCLCRRLETTPWRKTTPNIDSTGFCSSFDASSSVEPPIGRICAGHSSASTRFDVPDFPRVYPSCAATKTQCVMSLCPMRCRSVVRPNYGGASSRHTYPYLYPI